MNSPISSASILHDVKLVLNSLLSRVEKIVLKEERQIQEDVQTIVSNLLTRVEQYTAGHLHCCCFQPSFVQRHFIQCNKCDVWYHTSCVGVDSRKLGLIEDFLCPWCDTDHTMKLQFDKLAEEQPAICPLCKRQFPRPCNLSRHLHSRHGMKWSLHMQLHVDLDEYLDQELPLCANASSPAQLLCKVYWVPAAQVSKTAPSGEYLPTGSFMIRGKKNFLAPYRMEMGLTVLFEVRSEDVQRHFYDRKPREMEDAEWETLVKHGVPRVDAAESANDPEVFDADAEDYVIEVMDSVSAPKTAGKAVVRGHVDVKNSKNAKNSKNSKGVETKGGKKSLKGTTKKSRALAEEQAEMEALIAEQSEEPRKKEMSRGERRKMKKMKKPAAVDDEERR